MGAEIILRFDDPLTEILLPDAIHRDSGRQGIGRIDDPFREIEPCLRSAGRRLGQDGGHTGLHSDSLACDRRQMDVRIQDAATGPITVNSKAVEYSVAGSNLRSDNLVPDWVSNQSTNTCMNLP